MENKINSEVAKQDINLESKESVEQNEEDDDEIVDLDFEVEDQQIVPEENNEEEIVNAISPIITNNIVSTVQNTEINKKQTKKVGEFLSPKNTTSIRKLFLNTNSNLNSEENHNSGNNRTDQNNKTVLSKVLVFFNFQLAEVYGKKSLNSGPAKVSFYEFLLHDEHIQKYIDKHVNYQVKIEH